MTTKVLVSFPDEFLDEVDALAKAEHRSRSELVREALRHYMASREGTLRPGDLPEVRAAVQIQDEIARAVPSAGEDSTEMIRSWRERDK